MPKKEFTSFDIAAVTHELKSLILDSRLNNIYQLDKKTLLMKLHKSNQPPIHLILEAGRRLHLTDYALEKPQNPPAFCMALRKYLRNAWLRNVDQHEFERITKITFETNAGKLSIILELFGEGNIILTSEKGEILQALVYKRMRDRNVTRGELYQFPPPMGKNSFNVSKTELAELVEKNGSVEVVRILARGLSLGSVYAEETLALSGIDKTRFCANLNEKEIDSIFESLQILLSKISDFKIEPNIVFDEKGNFQDVIPFKLKLYEGCKSQTYSSINKAFDEFYLQITATEKAIEKVSGIEELQRELEKLKHVVSEQERALQEAREKSELHKQIGSIIYAHFKEIQELMDKFNNAKWEGRKWDSLISEVEKTNEPNKEARGIFESFDQRNLVVNLCINDIRFGLNLRKSLYENAAEFFEFGKKEKQKAAGAMEALERSRERLTVMEKKLEEMKQKKLAMPKEMMEDFIKHKVEKKEWFEKFRWFTSSEGFLVVAGKDAVSNEVLVKKHTDKDDLVFHADVTGSPFVVIKTLGKPVGEQTLQEASEFAASYSRAWREGLGSADIYWVKPEQLSKTGPSGEYVAHGAFALIGKRNWLRGVPLKLAVGIVDDKRELQFMGGPISSVRAKSKSYVVLLPGDLMGKEFLKKILYTLALNLPKEQRERISKASIEKIRDFVPYTRGRIIDIS